MNDFFFIRYTDQLRQQMKTLEAFLQIKVAKLHYWTDNERHRLIEP